MKTSQQSINPLLFIIKNSRKLLDFSYNNNYYKAPHLARQQPPSDVTSNSHSPNDVTSRRKTPPPPPDTTTFSIHPKIYRNDLKQKLKNKLFTRIRCMSVAAATAAQLVLLSIKNMRTLQQFSPWVHLYAFFHFDGRFFSVFYCSLFYVTSSRDFFTRTLWRSLSLPLPGAAALKGRRGRRTLFNSFNWRARELHQEERGAGGLDLCHLASLYYLNKSCENHSPFLSYSSFVSYCAHA